MTTKLRRAATTAAGLGLALAVFAAGAAEAAPDGKDSKNSTRECFLARNVWSWHPGADRTTVYLKANVHDYYELKLIAECPQIDWVRPIGIEHQGSSWICSGLDATLIVPQGSGNLTLTCPVRSVRKLSPEEVAALPPKLRP